MPPSRSPGGASRGGSMVNGMTSCECGPRSTMAYGSRTQAATPVLGSVRRRSEKVPAGVSVASAAYRFMRRRCGVSLMIVTESWYGCPARRKGRKNNRGLPVAFGVGKTDHAPLSAACAVREGARHERQRRDECQRNCTCSSVHWGHIRRLTRTRRWAAPRLGAAHACVYEMFMVMTRGTRPCPCTDRPRWTTGS